MKEGLNAQKGEAGGEKRSRRPVGVTWGEKLRKISLFSGGNGSS